MKDIVALVNVQRRATIYIPKFKNLAYEDRLKRLNLPTLTYCRLLGDKIYTFKIHKVDDNSAIPNLIPNNASTR